MTITTYPTRTAFIMLRLPEVLAARGIKKSTHYADIPGGLFTKPVKIGSRASAWPIYECEAIIQARVAGKSDEEIKQLVAQLEAARTAETA